MDNKYQLLRDPKVNPTDEIIAEGLGSAINAYIKFIDRLEHNDIKLMDWRYYNDGKAWLSKGEYKWITNRGTVKARPIFWLSIWRGFFKVSFFFSAKTQPELLTLPISQEAKNLIKNTTAMGKTMKFIPVVFYVSDDKHLDDLLVLAQFRKEKI